MIEQLLQTPSGRRAVVSSLAASLRWKVEWGEVVKAGQSADEFFKESMGHTNVEHLLQMRRELVAEVDQFEPRPPFLLENYR
jgi:hypothetical protein